METAEIIHRVLAGEERLFEVLVDRHAGLVWAICSSYLPNWADREDVAQDVFIQCYTRLHTLRNPSAFGAWLAQLARRACLDWVRKSARRRNAMAGYEERRGGSETVEDGAQAVEGRELHAFWMEKIRQLPPKTREAMFLCCGEGHTVKEAAEMLGVSPDSVSKRLEYGRRLLLEGAGAELDQVFASHRHRKEFVHAAIGAIPFGTAPWVAGGSAGAASVLTGKTTVLWGTAIMTKKTIIGAVLTLAFVGLLVGRLMMSPGLVEPAPMAPVVEGAAPPVPEGAPESGPQVMDLATLTADESSQPDENASSENSEASMVSSAPATATIAGTVRDMAAAPIEGALVQVELPDVGSAYEATTDAEGKYVITGVRAPTETRAIAYASAEGYVMVRERIKTLRPDAQVSGLDFKLNPAEFYVAGRVVSDGGQPIAGARVGTNYYGYDDKGLAQMEETGGLSGWIDGSGSDFVFSLTEPSGAFLLALPRAGYCDFTVKAEGFGPAFYPAVQTGTLDALFVLHSGGTITGTVFDAQNRPVEHANVEVVGRVFPGGFDFAIQELPLPTRYTTTDEHGVYFVDQLGEDFSYTVSVREKPPKTDPLPDEMGVAAVGRVVRSLSQSFYKAETVAAYKTGIRVRSGMVTSGIDLKLSESADTIIRGTVTDRTSGAPVAAVAVFAIGVDKRIESFEPMGKFHADSGASTVTLPDGTYSLRISSLSESRLYALTYDYFTEGGSVWQPNTGVVTTLLLEPGAVEEYDFQVDAPVTVPVRYVDGSGAPVEGVIAAVRNLGRGGDCGGTLVSDREGRVEFHGIPPYVTLEALAWRDSGQGLIVLGASAPFQGKPGERLEDVIVECHEMGGLEGTVLDATGTPLALTQLGLRGDSPSTGERWATECTTDANGSFLLFEALPEGEYPVVFIGRELDEGHVEGAAVLDVQVEGGMVTHLGTITLDVYTREEAAQVLQ